MELIQHEPARIGSWQIGHVNSETKIDEHQQRDQPVQRHGYASVAQPAVPQSHGYDFGCVNNASMISLTSSPTKLFHIILSRPKSLRLTVAVA